MGERIYVDLENLPEDIDCLAFEGNVYTSGLTFSSLDSAYIRLVNAETNQEMLRCALDRSTSLGAHLMSSRIMLLCKIFRAKDRWVLHADISPREQELRHISGRMPEMMYTADAPSGPAPVAAEVMEREITSVDMVQMDAGADLSGGKPKSVGQKPSRSYLLPGLAVASAAGAAAALAIFAHKSDNNQVSDFSIGDFDSNLFEGGVDFGNLNLDLPTECGCLSEFDCNCGFFECNCGDTLGGGVDFCDFDVLPDGCSLDPCIQLCGSGCESIGDLCAAGLDGAGDCFIDVGFCCSENCIAHCQCSEIGEQCGAICGSCGDVCQQCFENIGPACEQCQENAGQGLECLVATLRSVQGDFSLD